jgi:hypothetical protein
MSYALRQATTPGNQVHALQTHSLWLPLPRCVPWLPGKLQEMPSAQEISERARQLMAAMPNAHELRGFDARLAKVRKLLRQEFPGLRNITRLISRATAGAQRGGQYHARKRAGRPAVASMLTKKELDSCCRAVKAGRSVRGEEHGIRWTPAVIRGISPRCTASFGFAFPRLSIFLYQVPCIVIIQYISCFYISSHTGYSGLLVLRKRVNAPPLDLVKSIARGCKTVAL